MPARLTLALFGAATLAACSTDPLNGATVEGGVIGQALTFSGFYNQPGVTLRLEVLNQPTLDPRVAANWTQFATATTDTWPIYLNSTDPLYQFTVTAAPVPSAAFAARWPQGGLVRLRGLHPQGSGDYQLITFDSVTFGDCLSQQLAANADWTTIGMECQGAGKGTSAVVSISNIPAPPGNASSFNNLGYLGRKGKISAAETLEYYNNTGAPSTLAGFRAAYGFPAGEVTATYYNDGDLGLGREMHCKSFPYGTSQGVACYVTNYSGSVDAAGNPRAVFDVDPTTVLADAVARNHPLATVAMVYKPLPAGAANAVSFVAYGADGARLNTAQLDSTANNTSIPNNCLACHGINSYYNASSNAVFGAQFLPFDANAFLFSSAAGSTYGAQADALRRLNALVKLTNPTAAIAEFIDGTYAPELVTDPTATADLDYVPADWSNGTSNTVATAVYKGVVQVACRTCHISAASTALDFADYSDFSALATTIKGTTCGAHTMPHAERVMKKFWESGARAYLVTAFPPATYPDALSACKP